MNVKAFAQLLLLGALWGAAFMFLRIAAPEFGTFATAGARVGIACAIMLAVVFAMRLTFPLREKWRRYLAIGAVNTAGPFVLYCFAALHIPAAYSAIGNSTTPIWGALIAVIVFKERLNVAGWIGIVAAFAGVIALVGLQSVQITPLLIAGMLSVLIGAMMYAVAGFLIKRYLSDDGGIVGATGMVLGATCWLIPISLFALPAKVPSVQAWVAVLALAVFCTVLGYFMFFKLIREIGPQRASSVAFLFPAFAAFWGWFFLDESITINMLIGMALVLTGTALVSASQHAANSVHWLRFREWILWPLAFTFAPHTLRVRIARRIASDASFFASEVSALRANAPRFVPDIDLDAASREHRLLRFMDRCDVFLSAFREKHTLKHMIVAEGLPPKERAAVCLSAHRGNGWWMLLSLAKQGRPVELVSAPFPKFTTLTDQLWRPYFKLRWREMNRMGGLPLITMKGASKHVRSALENYGRVIATIDIPPALAKRCSEVAFFGRNAYMPRQVIDIAVETNATLWMVFGDVNAETLTQHVRFEPIDTSKGAQAAFGEYAAKLEAAIRQRPGSWHAWGDVDLYFRAN